MCSLLMYWNTKIVIIINAVRTTSTKDVVMLTEMEERTLWVKSVVAIELLPEEESTWVSGEVFIGDLLHILQLPLPKSPPNASKNSFWLFPVATLDESYWDFGLIEYLSIVSLVTGEDCRVVGAVSLELPNVGESTTTSSSLDTSVRFCFSNGLPNCRLEG